ncbi:hypothetical protein F0562_035360 [Nyssa sinensis]|uniref:malate dehydrogenase n=2 Tax=Magnoliopsida TaxID=3398 RepID=A0A5J5AEY1_9ASTE|nr:hypothetical protein F0562_035360 [Nyssa sinensis]
MSSFNLAKKLQHAKKAWKSFTNTLQSKLQKLNISKAVRKTTKRIIALRPIRSVIPHKLRSRTHSERLRSRHHHRLRHYHNYHQHQKIGFAAIYVDQLFPEPTSMHAKHLHSLDEASNGKMAKAEATVGVKVIDKKALPKKSKAGETSAPTMADAWKAAVSALPQLPGVDERAEEFISKFRQDMNLQREQSFLEFQQMLARDDLILKTCLRSPTMAKEPVRVLVTGAAGQIGYALVPMIARGVMLGPDQPVILHMLDIAPAAEALNGVKMELVDAAFPLLKGVVATTDVVEACTGVSIAVMVGGFPRKEGMERKDVMTKNVSIYKSQASALEEHAAANCKVLVVANPANTNALILKEFAPSIPEKNISCLTRLDHNRALGQISERLNVQTPAGEKPVRELVADDEWLKGEFITTVQQRGAAIIKARKFSSALSAASAACDHIRDWVLGTPEGTWVSMGVYSDGSYSVPAGLIYSFPVTCQKGEWTIVQGLSIDEFSRKKLDATAAELSEEKALAYSCLS